MSEPERTTSVTIVTTPVPFAQPGLRDHILRLMEEGVPAREMASRLALSPAVVQRPVGALAGELRGLRVR